MKERSSPPFSVICVYVLQRRVRISNHNGELNGVNSDLYLYAVRVSRNRNARPEKLKDDTS